jgi:hypothetical protein
MPKFVKSQFVKPKDVFETDEKVIFKLRMEKE